MLSVWMNITMEHFTDRETIQRKHVYSYEKAYKWIPSHICIICGFGASFTAYRSLIIDTRVLF